MGADVLCDLSYFPELYPDPTRITSAGAGGGAGAGQAMAESSGGGGGKARDKSSSSVSTTGPGVELVECEVYACCAASPPSFSPRLLLQLVLRWSIGGFTEAAALAAALACNEN